ncbi:MAG: hypothetical protein QM802_05245 [Agriterribacter sp.]
MIRMEFDELKKIWDTQNNQPLYVIDEKALHNRIQSKMKAVLHLTSISEWLLILINLVTGVILLRSNSVKPGSNIFLCLEAVWMFGIVVYLAISRIRRIKASRRFDRSIHGDLNHAISLASYQMRISQIIRWNFLPMGIIMILSGWEAGKLISVGAVILVSFTLAFYVTSKGYNANKKRKRELQGLKEKLETAI